MPSTIGTGPAALSCAAKLRSASDFRSGVLIAHGKQTIAPFGPYGRKSPVLSQ